jgi:membrane protease YdiL (CAAX protease family)
MNETVSAEATNPSSRSMEKPFPGIWAAIGWILLFFVMQVIVTIGFIIPHLDMTQGIPSIAQQASDPKIIAVPSIQAIVVANAAVIGLFLLYVRKGNRREIVGLNHWGGDDRNRTLLIAALLIGAALAFNIAYSVFIGSKVEMQKTLRDLLAAIPQTGFNTATIMFATVILAPIVEELIFRGLFQKSLARRLPIWAAIGIAAIVFSAMHGDLNSAPALFVIGAIFGTLYHLTGSLRVTIAAHLANNLLAMAAANFFSP